MKLIGLDRTEDNGPIHLTSATSTISTTGQLSAITHCDNVLDCVSLTGADLPKIAITVNAAGGFDVTNTISITPVDVDRLFAYRSGGGELMWVSLSKNGHIQFATRKAATTLPTAGRVSGKLRPDADAAVHRAVCHQRKQEHHHLGRRHGRIVPARRGDQPRHWRVPPREVPHQLAA